jgi:pullulanase
VVDLNALSPVGWDNDKSPAFGSNNPTDAVIYELHVRDASIHPSSGIKNKGKFLGLSEPKTKSTAGVSTGLQHFKDLGITHIHLLPFFDYNSIDESKPEKVQYNWGYDPLNYNALEGSYATDANNGMTRIKEMKQMVFAMHKNGLRVVMDVVYNHTGITDGSNFNQLVPGYYYRHKADGSFSDASACGNEVASEMPMMRKFMIESLKHWVLEYHIDGFRFDLMGIHDIETMNEISKALKAIKPDILLYGEGWAGGSSPMPEAQRGIKKNVGMLNGIAVFSDDIRDGIKGSVFNEKDNGFVSGKVANTESVKFGIVASCPHPQIDLKKVNYSKAPYATNPAQVITYAECHDNHTLWDKLKLSAGTTNEAERKKMHQLALAIVLTSQGIPFLHAGSEFLRDKQGVENSYNKPDAINAIDWTLKSKNVDVFNYTKELIKIRKAHPAFRLTSGDDVSRLINFEKSDDATIVYTINGSEVGDTWKKVLVAFNGTAKPITVTPSEAGGWKAALGLKGEFAASFKLDSYSAVILYQE